MSVYGYQEIIASAIENEVEAYNFYRSVGEKVADATLKAIFKELADEELKHREFLQGMLNQPEQMSFDAAKGHKVAGPTDTPNPTIWMKPSEAIGLAIKNENDAMTMYAELAKVSLEDTPQKAMFESLTRMEQGHKAKLETVFDGMAFAETW